MTFAEEIKNNANVLSERKKTIKEAEDIIRRFVAGFSNQEDFEKLMSDAEAFLNKKKV